jgi:tryptophanase
MKITIDTELEAIIVPDTFYDTIDKQNKVLADNGVEKRINYTDYVKQQFEKAIANPMKRNSDVKKKRRNVQTVSVKELQ